MRTRTVAGRTVAAIGLGDVSFARAAARNHDVGDVVRRVHDALELAIDVIDVAAEPDTLRAVGDAVRATRARDRAVIATTVRLPDVRDIGGLQAGVEADLRASKLDAMPLVQLPLPVSWLAHRAWPELAGACDRLAREGKVLAWGAIVASGAGPGTIVDRADVTNEEPPPPPDPLDIAGFATTGSGLFVPSTAPPPAAPKPKLEHPLALPMFASLAIDFSLCEREAAPLLAIASHAIFARRPLAGGALGGELGPGAVLSRTDDRRALDLDAIAIAVAKLARFVKRAPPAATSTDAARGIAETAKRPAHVECESVAELALRYAIDRGALVLPRVTSRAHLDDAIAAASASPLSADLMTALDT
ncbi:MAG TPA: aldo/keto reductase [Kofleriaceae bacterium]|jgi:aryl-alcohol dehydrogenase-like predicted oxidoreductase